MSRKQLPDDTGFQLQCHAPERRRAQEATVLCCGCSCCCCCLHSAGSLLGAVAGSINLPGGTGIRRSAAWIYWALFFPTIGLCMLLVGGAGTQGDRETAILLGALALPFIQIGVSLVAIAALPFVQPKGAYLWSLAKITIGTVAGAILGTLLMVGLYVLFVSVLH